MKRLMPRKSYILSLWSVLILPNVSLAAAKAGNTATPLPVLNKWFALGSGCKASWETKGDVFVESPKPTTADSFKIRFSIPKFKLDAPAGSEVGKKAEAKECALRLNVNPPANKRVKFVTATTSLSESKATNSELTVLTELKIGTDTLHRNVQQYPAAEAFSNKVRQVQMIPGSKPDEMFPTLKCGTPKIIALNFTFLAKRTEKNQSAMAELSGDKSVDVVVDLEDCKP